MSKKRLLLTAGGITTVAAAATLVAGVTFGFFTSTANSNTNAFTAGTITLTRTTNTACTYANPFLEPGDLIAPCELGVTYGGNLPAWVALDVQINYPTASVPLYGGDNSSGLTFTITDGEGAAKSFTVPTTASYTGGDCPASHTCWEAVDLLAATDSGSSPDANSNLFHSGDTATLTVQPTFPTSVGNAFQNGTATIVLTAHATQTRNNGSIGTCTTGLACNAAGDPSWTP